MVYMKPQRDLKCPNCGASELHPKDKTKVLIRGYKVNYGGKWLSQCLVCSGMYESLKNLVLTEDRHDPNKGWFS